MSFLSKFPETRPIGGSSEVMLLEDIHESPGWPILRADNLRFLEEGTRLCPVSLNVVGEPILPGGGECGVDGFHKQVQVLVGPQEVCGIELALLEQVAHLLLLELEDERAFLVIVRLRVLA